MRMMAQECACPRGTRACLLLAATMLVAAVDPVRGNSTNTTGVWSSGSGIGVQCDMRLPPTDFQFPVAGYERCYERR